MRLRALRDAWPLIIHPHIPVLAFSLNPHFDRTCFRRVFQGVRQKVSDYLADARSITPDRYGLLARMDQVQRPPWKCPALLLYGQSHNSCQICPLEVTLQTSHLDARSINQIVDQPIQAPKLLPGQLQRV